MPPSPDSTPLLKPFTLHESVVGADMINPEIARKLGSAAVRYQTLTNGTRILDQMITDSDFPTLQI